MHYRHGDASARIADRLFGAAERGGGLAIGEGELEGDRLVQEQFAEEEGVL